MLVRKFLKLQENKALELGKEDSAAVLLMAHILDVDTVSLYHELDNEISEETVARFNESFSKYLYENKPIQYLIGETCFFGYDFYVNEDVLIPRFETEELVENVLYEYDRLFKGQKIKVCDVATGSGCIGLTLAKEERNMELSLTDISAKALEVAKKNAKRLGVDVKFYEGDMLEPLTEKFDILVSNPPYIPEDEEVMSLVKDNEPNIALFGGKDGLKFYRVILSGAKRILKDDAIIAFEHGYDKRQEIEALALEYFKDAKVKTLKDLEGKDRMTFIYIGKCRE